MTTGSQSDIVVRLQQYLPRGWFGDFNNAPNINAVLQGAAWGLSTQYALLTFAALQTRIATATGGWLDLISNDFFGTALPRLQNESDGAFRARILANLFVKGPTRGDMSAVLTLITGRKPDIFEPSNTTDSGGWDGGFYWDSGVGRWGAPMPYQSLVTAYRPATSALSLGELDSFRWSFDTYGAWSDSPVTSVTDAAIIAAVESTRAVGTVVWLRITNGPVTP
ncbi:hypothetical protein G3N95_30135 [Paraburkholderia sp. Tr-20389]|uniref:hypothetical protein n=1 Tax=Paraburkholderia sp. Tr-20389 TaxID=2703903 RepID=UPI00197EB97C|nr:hypothetical protein [Paraburkholderia sp. Tr-20389]MBN3757235.1 hypothetical protein [Paraburkholderia sp. Tr-20389]